MIENQSIPKRPEPKTCSDYGFSYEFELKIVALLLSDKEFLAAVAGKIKPEHFENEPLAQFVELALAYYERYGEVISEDAVDGHGIMYQ